MSSRRNRSKAVLFLAVSLLAALSCRADQGEEALLAQEARELSNEFIARLKPQLKNAMSSDGPAYAIEVCATEAPRIADALSSESGWRVRRVSLKQRNPSRATPDDWETAVLKQFDRRQAAGEDAAELEHWEMQGSHFRFMRAQTVEPLCLLCHGSDRPAEVTETLQMFYPDDIAVGYSLGQVRGAISLCREP